MPLPPDDPSQHDEHDELSPDPDENLRIQNELLKLKMQAELGAEFGGDMSDLPPEVERQILQHLMRFHEAQGSGEVSTVGQQLGQEEWPKAETFSSETALTDAWNDLQERLTRARLHVGFLADYPLSLKWDFITQELMKKETFPIKALEALQFGPQPDDVDDDGQQASGSSDADSAEEDDESRPPISRAEDFSDDEREAWEASGMPGELTGVGFMGFIYEEYHPNHAYSIENKVRDLLKDFFENSFGEYSSEISNPLVTEAGKSIPRDAFIEKVARFHDLFAGGIKEWEFTPLETVWDTPLDDEGKATEGSGKVEGSVRYVVTTDDGADIEIAGPFEAYLEYGDDWWSIFFFQLHGFSWA